MRILYDIQQCTLAPQVIFSVCGPICEQHLLLLLSGVNTVKVRFQRRCLCSLRQ